MDFSFSKIGERGVFAFLGEGCLESLDYWSILF